MAVLLTPRENVLEKKISFLEQRLVLVERFVEMRFCESFRDFTIRNNTTSSFPIIRPEEQSCGVAQSNQERKTAKSNAPSDPERITISQNDGENLSDEERDFDAPQTPPTSLPQDDEEDDSPPTYLTRSGRKTNRLTATSLSKPSTSSKSRTAAAVQDASATKKVLRVSIRRLNLTQKDIQENKTTNSEVEKKDDENAVSNNANTTIVKLQYDSSCENEDVEDQSDNYFTFPSEGTGRESTTVGNNELAADDDGDGDQIEVYGDGEDDGDGDWNPSTGEEDRKFTPSTGTKRQLLPIKRKKKPYKKRPHKKMYFGSIKNIAEGVPLQVLDPSKTKLKECPLCHTHWKPEAFDKHMESQHTKERHLKCSYCEKRFYKRNILCRHERIHKLAEVGSKCRLCSKLFVDNFRALAHERICIRRRFQANEHVDPFIVEDVRQRSQKVDLKWPDTMKDIPEGMKKCVHCKKLFEEDLYLPHVKEAHRRWKCTFCDRKYVDKGALVRHLCNAHGDNCVSCENLCGKTFETREEARSHYFKCIKERKRQDIMKESEKVEVPPQATETGSSVSVEDVNATTADSISGTADSIEVDHEEVLVSVT